MPGHIRRTCPKKPMASGTYPLHNGLINDGICMNDMPFACEDLPGCDGSGNDTMRCWEFQRLDTCKKNGYCRSTHGAS